MRFSKLKIITPIALSISVLFVSLSGCTTANRNRNVPPGTTIATPGPNQNLVAPGTGNGDATTPGTPPGNRYGWVGVTPGPNASPFPSPQAMMQDNRQRAENIRKQLNSNNMYDQLNVVVVDNIALVGYNPRNTAGDVQATNRSIADRVKQIDPQIANVAVTGTAEPAGRIRRLGTDIVNNRPMNEIRTEANQILQNIAPTLR